MATLKLVSPDPKALYWRAAIGSTKGIPGEPIDSAITLKLLTKNYYKFNVDLMDGEGEVLKSFSFEESMTVYGDYQINGQTGEFSEIS
jgi:hypothetical protein